MCVCVCVCVCVRAEANLKLCIFDLFCWQDVFECVCVCVCVCVRACVDVCVCVCVCAGCVCVVRLCVALSMTSVYQLNKCLLRGGATGARVEGSSAVQWGIRCASLCVCSSDNLNVYPRTHIHNITPRGLNESFFVYERINGITSTKLLFLTMMGHFYSDYPLKRGVGVLAARKN